MMSDKIVRLFEKRMAQKANDTPPKAILLDYRIGLHKEQDIVIVEFSQPVKQVALTPQQARDFARSIVKQAKKLERRINKTL